VITNPKSQVAAEALIKALGNTPNARIVVEGFYAMARLDGMLEILRLEEQRKVKPQERKAA